LSTLVAALDAAGLVETFADCEGGPFTVFAPTNDAFAAALEALGLTAEQLLADTETLTTVLTYHVVEGAVDAATVVTLDSATTLQGEDIAIAVEGDTVVLNDSVNVVTTDIEACNGIVHVIDGVLLPPSLAGAAGGGEEAEAESEDLPATGSNNTAIALIAGVALLGGVAALTASRRRGEV
ncbi:MAG: fasciclin domain-containing protein, partial [Ilumatobacteraceae bacterium]|nr:fasciclin domain-containing protein [Ilumatobacteraceae bacterium]